MIVVSLLRPLLLVITIACHTINCEGSPHRSTSSGPSIFNSGGKPASRGPSSAQYAVPKDQFNTPTHRMVSLNKRVIITTYIDHPFMPGSFPNVPYLWIARLQIVQSLFPVQPAVSTLGQFYETAMQLCLRQFRENSMVRASTITFGPFTLDIFSRDGGATIPWVMIASFLEEVKMMAERGLEGAFSGEIGSVMTGWIIFVRLRILGFPEDT